ncbi:MAG: helix-turn-helix transcriptional regulator [Cyclobacteriaceae bacterium]|nr:helix-turn-helix transcriptional regulator [Cyclobacteriaceae bacterium]
MKVINLPDDIFPGNKMLMDPILIHHYSATVGSMNGRSVLNKNAISLVLKGEKTMHFSQKVVKIKDDEFHFLSAGNCLASIDLSGQDVFTSILIFFDTKVLADFHVKYNEQISRIRKRIKIVQESYISFKKDSFVLNLITSLQLSTEGGKQMSLQMRLLKFEELMLHLLEKYPETILSFQIPEKDGNDDLTLRKVVETNVLNPISIEELAFLCNLSLSTFKRRFIKLYGTTPSKWLVGRRMEFAANLLQHHHAKPSEVFFKVGYENHSSFTHSFKQSFGLTPKEFQAKN